MVGVAGYRSTEDGTEDEGAWTSAEGGLWPGTGMPTSLAREAISEERTL